MKKITNSEFSKIMEKHDFPDEMKIGKSVIILTQSWCPQWTYMKDYLKSMETKNNIRVYYIEYDNEPNFEEIMHFKEETFKNDEVPFCIYYKDGIETGKSNMVYEEDIINFWK